MSRSGPGGIRAGWPTGLLVFRKVAGLLVARKVARLLVARKVARLLVAPPVLLQMPVTRLASTASARRGQ